MELTLRAARVNAGLTQEQVHERLGIAMSTLSRIECGKSSPRYKTLAYLGYYPGGIDGVAGQKTRQAIRNFQGAEGLGVDGVAGEQTAIRLKDAVWQDRFAKDNIVPSSGQPPDLPSWWRKYKWFAPSEFRCPCGKCGGGIAKMHEGIVAEAIRKEKAGA